MTSNANEVIHNGIVIDGNVHHYDDDADLVGFDENNLSISAIEIEIAAEQNLAKATLETIDLYQSSRELERISKRGYDDTSVRNAGGVHTAKTTAHQKLKLARKTYLEARHLPAELPENGDQDSLDKYAKGVSEWYSLRKQIDDPQACAELRVLLETKL